MGKVISSKSGEQLGGCDFKENDEFVISKGEYIGYYLMTTQKYLERS